MKRAVSVSIGSSRRDKTVTIELLDQQIELSRQGTDGDEARARARFTELDGSVDALGVGGIELYLRVADREYPLHAGLRLVADVKHTPVVDGRGVKHTLERRVFELAAEALGGVPHYRRAFMNSGADRYGMAQALEEVADTVVYGDMMFALGVPLKVTSLAAVRRLTRVTMPVIGRLPISVLYPTGAKQDTNTPKFAKEWAAADLLAGDFLYIRKYASEDLSGKTVVTNTTTADDVEFLRGRGVQWLITTTPRLDGRSFGTNAFEAALTAAAGKGRPLTEAEIDGLIDELALRPTVERLNP